MGPFTGRFVVMRNGHGGKAHALNTGIDESTGEIVVNVDSDVVLEQHCVAPIAEAFVHDPEMGAATGNIEIDWDMVEARDRDGRAHPRRRRAAPPKRLNFLERFLAKSQFLEYLASFRLGRRRRARSARSTRSPVRARRFAVAASRRPRSTRTAPSPRTPT